MQRNVSKNNIQHLSLKFPFPFPSPEKAISFLLMKFKEEGLKPLTYQLIKEYTRVFSYVPWSVFFPLFFRQNYSQYPFIFPDKSSGNLRKMLSEWSGSLVSGEKKFFREERASGGRAMNFFARGESFFRGGRLYPHGERLFSSTGKRCLSDQLSNHIK